MQMITFTYLPSLPVLGADIIKKHNLYPIINVRHFVLNFVPHRYRRMDVLDWLEYVLIDLWDWDAIPHSDLPEPSGIRPEQPLPGRRHRLPNVHR